MLRWSRILVAAAWLAEPAAYRGQPRLPDLPGIAREEMIVTAKRLAEHVWVCREANLRAACVRNYDTDWRAGQRVVGVPYDWGGMDGPEEFDKKLAQGLAAGSHSRHGISSCTAGIDCSGFVAMCWGQRTHKYSTSNLLQIAGRPRYIWYTEMKPGDALVKPGSHVVLFAGYNPDGTPNVYEASGSAKRVVFQKSPWSRFKDYYPLRYKLVADP